MSVLIHMEMPKDCYDCPMAMSNYTTILGKNRKQTCGSYSCVLTHKAITSTKRSRFCPLIEIPPHGRLIDADDAEEILMNDPTCITVFTAIKRLKEMPFIIPADKEETC